MHAIQESPVLLNCQAAGIFLCNINPRLVKRKLPYPAGTGAIFYVLSKFVNNYALCSSDLTALSLIRYFSHGIETSSALLL